MSIRVVMRSAVLTLGLVSATAVTHAAPSCDRLVDGGVRDCNMRLGLDAYELTEQTVVKLTPAQLDRAANQRPLRELELSPGQFGEVQAYCRSHGEIRRRIGIQQGLCAEPPAD